jgi:hypothetical protein
MTFMPHQQFKRLIIQWLNRSILKRLCDYKVLLLCTTVSLGSCSTSSKPWVYVEDFRSYGETDDDVIQQAIDEAGPSGVIYFEPGREYVLYNDVLVKSSQILVGNNATLKRGTQVFSFLSKPCAASSDTLIIDSIPRGWKVGDQLQVFTDAQSYNSNAFGDYHKLPNIITRIEKNKIFLSSSVGTSLSGAIKTWPAGTFVRKVFTMLRADSIQFRSATFSVVNMNFNGNKRQNDLNYYWNVNSTIFVRGLGSKIEDCRFYNIPNENIVGQGIYITNCQAEDLNGSFVHFSGVDTASHIVQKHSTVIGNYINKVCLLSTKTTGHSEGAFTTSYNGGFASISNNRVFNCGEAVLGIVDAPYDIADGGKSEIIMTGNLFKNCAKIVYDIAYVKSGLKPSTDIYIADNIFSNCGYNDWTKTNFKQYEGFKIGNNGVTNGTFWKY